MTHMKCDVIRGLMAGPLPRLAGSAADEDKPYGWSRNLEYPKRGKASAKRSPIRGCEGVSEMEGKVEAPIRQGGEEVTF